MVHNQDALVFLAQAPRFRTIFADIPDNIGLNYVGFRDQNPDYIGWLMKLMTLCMEKSDIFWLSYNQIWDLEVKSVLLDLLQGQDKAWKQIIWRFTFGQYQETTFASGYRPILLVKSLETSGINLNYDAVRVESARQKLGDKRAHGPRVPDDVWEFPRIVGNSKERRDWHPTQHPEALLERILLLSNTDSENKSIGSVCDPFLGSGTTAIVAKRLGIPWTGCEISPFYCKMLEEI